MSNTRYFVQPHFQTTRSESLEDIAQTCIFDELRGVSNCSETLLAEALFLLIADGRKETSAMGRKWLWFNRRPQSWTALLQRMLLTLFADRKLSPFRLTHYFTLIPLSFIEPTLMTRSLSRGACSIQPFSTHGRGLFSPVSDQQEKSLC